MTHPRPRLRWLSGVGATVAAIALALALSPSPAGAAPDGHVVGADRPNAVADSYLVTLRNTEEVRSRGVRAVARELADRHGGAVTYVYTAALRGFAVKLDERAARRLAAHSKVRQVEQDGRVSIQGTQSPVPSWGLDRIDQRDLPLDNSYTYPNTASNVTAYIIDTGVLITHQDFGGRARHGRDTVDNDNDATDCHGHGTHVAGTVGGTSYGVAKEAKLVGVRVLNCSGSGTWAQVTAGIDWVTANAVKPAVANMSLGGSGSNATMETAVRNSIASGVSYAIAAGNSNSDACNFTPARVPEAITLGATDSSDNRASFSNYGTCLDLFAPGVSITSAWIGSNTATRTISGTSMASPHAAGAAALILGANPGFTAQQVRDTMVNNATPGKVGNPGPGSPNLLLFVGGAAPPPPPPDAVFADDFETDKGWTRNPTGGDTATTGLWSRGDPQQTSWNGHIMQRGDTTSGVNGLITDPLAGTSVGDRDIDGGATSIQSPQITMPSSGTLTLTFSWYLGHLSNSSSADYLRVSVVSGSGTSTVFQRLGAATDTAAVWQAATVDLSGYAGQTIRLRIGAADASTASLVEAGVDDIKIVNS